MIMDIGTGAEASENIGCLIVGGLLIALSIYMAWLDITGKLHTDGKANGDPKSEE